MDTFDRALTDLLDDLVQNEVHKIHNDLAVDQSQLPVKRQVLVEGRMELSEGDPGGWAHRAMKYTKGAYNADSKDEAAQYAVKAIQQLAMILNAAGMKDKATKIRSLLATPIGKREELEELVEGSGEVGATILAQMGGRRLLGMTGAKAITSKDGLTLKWPARKRAKTGNVVKITLRPDDTYDMEFFNTTMKIHKSVKKYTGVHADKLAPIFSRQAELALSI